MVSDLTYVRVGMRWRISAFFWIWAPGRSSGTAQALVRTPNWYTRPFRRWREPFRYPDVPCRSGSEFDNALIDEPPDSFQISRCLSMKGCPCDNAVAESTLEMIEAEFVSRRRFDTLGQLQLELAD